MYQLSQGLLVLPAAACFGSGGQGFPQFILFAQSDFTFADSAGRGDRLTGLMAVLLLPRDRRGAAPCARPSPCATHSASCCPVDWPPSRLAGLVVVGGVTRFIL